MKNTSSLARTYVVTRTLAVLLSMLLLLAIPLQSLATENDEEVYLDFKSNETMETLPTTKLTVSEVTHSVFYAPQYVAINLGFFEKYGIEVELINSQGADKVMAAVLSGQVDIGFAGPEACIYVYLQGKKDYPQVFAQLTKRDGSFLVGRNKDEVFSWENLSGKHVLPGRKGGVPYMALEYVIKQNGLNPATDMNFDNSISFDAMTGAFVGGIGDYVTIFEPTATMLELEGRGYIVASVGEAAGEIPYTAYFANKSFIEENPEVIQSFTNALQKGMDYVNSHTPEEIAKVIAPQFAETPVETITTIVTRYHEQDTWKENLVFEEDAFMLLQNILEEAGELHERVPYADLVTTVYAQEAAKQQ